MQKELFEHAINHLKDELRNIQTGRANPAIFADVPVEAYGNTMRMQELASITSPEPQLVVIQPWDRSVLQAIEIAIRKSPLTLEPVVDGEIVRVAFAALTEEKRKELVKLMNTKVEEARVAIRKVREELMKDLKKMKQDGDMGEDEFDRQEKEVQKTVDEFNDLVKEIGENKEKELMTV